MADKDIESLVRSTIERLGLSNSFITSSSDTIEMLGLLSSVCKEDIVKVFEAFALYYIINFADAPHKKCVLPFLGQLNTTVFERTGRISQNADGSIVQGENEIGCEVSLHLLSAISEDIKNIKLKHNVKLNTFNKLTDRCVESMKDSENE